MYKGNPKCLPIQRSQGRVVYTGDFVGLESENERNRARLQSGSSVVSGLPAAGRDHLRDLSYSCTRVVYTCLKERRSTTTINKLYTSPSRSRVSHLSATA